MHRCGQEVVVSFVQSVAGERRVATLGIRHRRSAGHTRPRDPAALGAPSKAYPTLVPSARRHATIRMTPPG